MYLSPMWRNYSPLLKEKHFLEHNEKLVANEHHGRIPSRGAGNPVGDSSRKCAVSSGHINIRAHDPWAMIMHHGNR